MGTHPIFESDFDCLTEWRQMTIKGENGETKLDPVQTKWQVAKKGQQGGCLTPRPRAGHRIVSMRGLILLFGGGDSGMVDDLLVYSTENGNWFQPSTNGQVPSGVAAFGMAADGTRIIIHGGMQEYGRLTNSMYELQASKWEWKKLEQKCAKGLKQPPTSRMCHSFSTLGGSNGIPAIDKIVLFGGVRNHAEHPEKQFKPEYLGDVFYLELLSSSGVGAWTKPDVTGTGPSPRESHSAVVYKPEGRAHMVVVYGGKDRHRRLADLFTLDTGTNTWTELKPLGLAPPPRSLHTAQLISKDRMVVIGGLVPRDAEREKMVNSDDPSGNDVWSADDQIYILDLAADEWLDTGFSGDREHEKLPKPRSHAASTLIDSRVYVFAGREDNKAINSMLFLETSVPVKPSNLRLLKGGETSIEVAWNAVKNSDQYLLQVCPIGGVEKKKKVEPKKEEKKEEVKKEKPEKEEEKKTEEAVKKPEEKEIEKTKEEKKPESEKPLEKVGQKDEENQQTKAEENNPKAMDTSPSPGVDNKEEKPVDQAEPQSVEKKPESNDADKMETVKLPVSPKTAAVEPEKTPVEPKSGSATPTRDEAEDKMDTAPPPPAQPAVPAAKEEKKEEAEKAKEEADKVKEKEEKAKAEEKAKSDGPMWFDVAMIPSSSQPRHEIKWFYVESETRTESDSDCLFLDGDKYWRKQMLGSGITYRVRVCAINSCGRSVFSDYSAYKTTVPGFPRAPTSIKVTKTDDGASLSWSPPVNTEIIEYSVYLAVKQSQATGKTNNFIRVYLGHQPNCIVSHSQLAQAATNTESSNKPAVIFRIAAKNKKGYGPATQVRWLQDSKVKRQAQNMAKAAAAAAAAEAAKRAKTTTSSTS